jgi:hypothetical protein
VRSSSSATGVPRSSVCSVRWGSRRTASSARRRCGRCARSRREGTDRGRDRRSADARRPRRQRARA